MGRMFMTRREAMAAAASLAAVGTLADPRRAQSETPKIIKIHQRNEMQVLDPANRISFGDEIVMLAIFSHLVQFKPGDTWELSLDAAEEIEQIDPVTVRFRLRPGIMWTNGYGELTTEDVKFSYERIADPDFNAAYYVDWQALDHVEIVDKYTGVIHLKNPFAPLWASSLPFPSGAIICKRAVEDVGGKFTLEPPATSGPYVIKELIIGQKVVLARNPLWNGPRYEFDEIHLIPITDFKTAEIGFEAGDLDICMVSMSSVPHYQKNPVPGSTLSISPSLYYFWLGMNSEHPLLQDIRVRQAIQKSVDVDEVLDAAFMGVAARGYGIVPTGLLGSRDHNIMGNVPDRDGARKLLAEAGYPDGLKLSLAVQAQADYETAAQVIQANLAEVGVDVQIDAHDPGAFWSLGLEADGDMYKDLQLYIQRFGTAPDPSWTSAWFVCDQVGVWNWERVCNPEFDDLHEKALAETDSEKRADMYRRMQDLMELSGAYVFLTHGVNAVMYKDWLVPPILPHGLYMSPQFFRSA